MTGALIYSHAQLDADYAEYLRDQLRRDGYELGGPRGEKTTHARDVVIVWRGDAFAGEIVGW